MYRYFFQAAGLLLLPFAAYAAPLIVLDPGHTPSQGGALGVRGQYEVVYNDRIAAELKTALEADGWQVAVTRKPDEERTLTERAGMVNQAKADIFLSLHHDSAQPQYLKKIQVSGKEAYQTLRPISGYSLFVSGDNPKFDQSYKLASSIGKEIRAIGRTPAAHHAEPITGENRPWLDKENGVYRYDKLAVLRQTVMPAVLLEFGVIVDRDDEAYVDDAINRRRMTEAVVRALRPYRHH